jgi:hypothetical protein
MSLQWTTAAQLTMPSAADAVSATGANSAWITVSSGGPAVASVLTGILVGAAEFSFHTFFLDIGVGAAASEVVIYTADVDFENSSSLSNYLPVVVPTALMPAGVRVAFRVRSAAALAYKCALTYMPAVFTGTMQTTTQPVVATSFVNMTTNVTPWANSAWVQLIASTATAIVLHGFSFVADNFNLAHFEVDIGVGAAGVEVPVTGHAGYNGGSSHVPWILPWQNPFDGIGAGLRVAARVRSSASSAITVPIALHYWAKPL